ncbi:Gfo/Idh/MocA family protein [Planctomycetota bacterium]
MKTYSASVVGGGSGGRLSLTGLRDSDRYELVAAVDMREDVCTELKELYPGLRTFTSHQELFRECPTDVICVSTWAPSHREITLGALDLPLKGILVEKPLGDTAAAGRDIIEAIKSRNLPMTVPHNMIVQGPGKAVLAAVGDGAIGELQLVDIESDKWDIMNAGIHWLNYFIALTGNENIDRVLALCDTSTRTFRDGMQVETEAVSYIVTQSGIRYAQHTGDYIPIKDRDSGCLFRIVGSAGQIEYHNFEKGFRLQNAEYPAGTFIEPDPESGSKHQIYLDIMAAQIDGGSTDYRIADRSMMALEAVEAAYLSSRRKCMVTFPLADFSPPELTDWDPGMPYGGKGGGRDGRKLP